MISLIGFSSLFISFVLGIIIFVIFFFQNKKHFDVIFICAIYLNFFCVLLSFFSLMFAYIYSDFTNYNVFQNSHSSKPLIYKIAGTWGNHEGSMLLWLLIMVFYNFLFSFNKTLDKDLKRLTIFFQTSLYLCFCSYVIFASNPFLVNTIEMSEGLGLNPILQDPVLAIHPPMLYFGYIGFSLILSLAIAGLILNKININWIFVTRNWTLFCWSMLTGGIALGSYWHIMN